MPRLGGFEYFVVHRPQLPLDQIACRL